MVVSLSAKVCGKPLDGEGTVMVPDAVNLIFDHTYVYSCLPGYEPATPGMDMVTRCDESAQFSLEPLPTCVGTFEYV